MLRIFSKVNAKTTAKAVLYASYFVRGKTTATNVPHLRTVKAGNACFRRGRMYDIIWYDSVNAKYYLNPSSMYKIL